MDVFIVGEDDVTKTIIQRLLNFCSNEYSIIAALPARGGKIKSLIENFNILSQTNPVVLLTDLDTYDCPPTLLNRWFGSTPRNSNFLVRVAIDEAEAWLMADREGFAKYFKVPVEKIPTSRLLYPRRPSNREMDFPYKSSLYLMREIIPFTSNNEFITTMVAVDGISKGPEYNSTILPFINSWNIDNACNHSTSLQRTVNRLRQFSS